MAKQKLYQVFDSVAETTLGPIIQANRDNAAIRIFQEALSDERTDLAKHPEDYELLHLGELDTNSGAIEPGAEVISIYSGAQWTRERARAAAKPAELPADSAPALKLNSNSDTHIL